MKKLFAFVIAFAMLSSGCATTSKVIPDQSIPHEVAKETVIEVWCGVPNRKLRTCKVRLLDGWWVASPEALQ